MTRFVGVRSEKASRAAAAFLEGVTDTGEGARSTVREEDMVRIHDWLSVIARSCSLLVFEQVAHFYVVQHVGVCLGQSTLPTSIHARRACHVTLVPPSHTLTTWSGGKYHLSIAIYKIIRSVKNPTVREEGTMCNCNHMLVWVARAATWPLTDR